MKYNCTDYFLGDDIVLRNPTNEELGANGSIIGVLEGTHFCPASVSRNKRYYGLDLWQEQLQRPNIREKLENKTMVGTIGHDLEIGEKEFREGMISHFTTNLRIVPTGDPKKPYRGIGESYILNTPAGRALKTYVDAGMKLFFSTRADGDFLPGVMHRVAEDGTEVPVLDKSRYNLNRVDVVLNPGFLDAQFKLREELGVDENMLQSINESYREFESAVPQEDNNSSQSIKENIMPTVQETSGNELLTKGAGDVIIQTTDDNAISMDKIKGIDNHAKGTNAPHNKIATATDAVTKDGVKDVVFDDNNQNTLTETLMTNLLASIEALKAENAQLREAVASDQKPLINDLTTKMLADNLKKMDPKGKVGGGAESNSNKGDLLASLKRVEEFCEEHGEFEEIAEALATSSTFFEANGSPADIIAELEASRAFREKYGEFDQVADVMDIMEQFITNVGSIDEVYDFMQATHEFFAEMGTPNEVKAVLEYYENFFNTNGAPEKVQAALQFAREVFEEFGSPATIRANMEMLEQVREKVNEFNELGLTDINEMKSLLEDINKMRLENQALAIAEHTGLNSNYVLERLHEGMTEHQIVSLHNQSASFADRYLTVREDCTGSYLDKIPLKTVDPDGDHVELKNVSYKIGLNENQPRLNRLLASCAATAAPRTKAEE